MGYWVWFCGGFLFVMGLFVYSFIMGVEGVQGVVVVFCVWCGRSVYLISTGYLFNILFLHGEDLIFFVR